MYKKLTALLIAGFVLFATNETSFAMMCGADSRHSEYAQAAPQNPSEKAANVGNEVCPVSGEKIVENMKTTHEHDGKIYNFCCASCIDEFKKDPDKYTKKVK